MDGILERGKAKPGDKTVIDALAPAVQALAAGGAAGTALPGGAPAAAAAAAGGGLEATKEMVAQRGKAAAFQEKTPRAPGRGRHGRIRSWWTRCENSSART